MARFQPGMPRPANAGRKKGSKNKRTLLKAEQLLLEKNIHPIELLIKLLPSLTPSEQARTLLELMKFVQPQLRHFESSFPSSNQSNPLKDSDEDTGALLKVVDGKES